MGTDVLVTGGAGFVGSHLVEVLLHRGHRVRVLDALVPQVHGPDRRRPRYLPDDAEFIHGDVRDRQVWRRALKGIRVVFHDAAEVGVGQSMYQPVRYVEANTLGTAILLEELISGGYAVEKLIVASSMSIYGEGQYRCRQCGVVSPEIRPTQQLADRQWEVRCPSCREPVAPEPTPESKPLLPTSVYAVTKRDQEELCLMIGRAYRLPTVALRYFNIYGPRQSLSNPYTGVAAIFSSRLRNGKPPKIFEDGQQKRDFIHVSDIVEASLLAMERREADYDVFNVGTGCATSVLEVAQALREALGVAIQPEIVQQYRAGDIRHCYADIAKIRARLGFEPKRSLRDGVRDLVAWAREAEAVDRVDQAMEELAVRGLAR
jgi:dTDP-L-rhamnose 4-epimerase